MKGYLTSWTDRTTPVDLTALCWSAERLSEVVEALAQAAGYLPDHQRITATTPPQAHQDLTLLAAWLESLGQEQGLELEPVQALYPDLARFVVESGPSLLVIENEGSSRSYLAVLGGTSQGLRVLGPDRQITRLRPERLARQLAMPLFRQASQEVDTVLTGASLSITQQLAAGPAMAADRLQNCVASRGWLLRPGPTAALWTQLRYQRIPHFLAGFVGLRTVGELLYWFSWWLLIQFALPGEVLGVGIGVWALLLLTTVPFWVASYYLTDQIAIWTGALLRQNLLAGALNLPVDEVKEKGVGELLGRLLEVEEMEDALQEHGGVFLLSLIEIGVASLILAFGAGGLLHTGLLVGWLALCGLLIWRYMGYNLLWNDHFLSMTQNTIERILGHTTRLQSETAGTWHEEEDQILSVYGDLSRRKDRLLTLIGVLIPYGWLLVGIAGVIPAFLSGTVSPAALGISFLAIIKIFEFLDNLSGSIQGIGRAWVAWIQASTLMAAPESKSQTEEPPPLPDPYLDEMERSLWRDQPAQTGETLLEAHSLTYTYPQRREAALTGASLTIRAGDRLLLQGPSGGGKSTLAALITGLLPLQQGSMLLTGNDARSMRLALWRRRMISAPQFQENYLFNDSLAFNLLLGWRWPAMEGDLAQAQAICEELGLGELLKRMPQGIWTAVGEQGWRLSQGERSRVYIARALLQEPDLLILDESFAAMDPENMALAFQAVEARVRTLMVIAHP